MRIITTIFELIINRRMKYLYKSIFIIIILASTMLGSCKKQVKCGCDGDKINSVAEMPVIIYYDAEAGSASFVLETNPMATYYFCNPGEMMPELINYEIGTKILVDCDIYYECNYMMQASNSYVSYYQTYMADVSKVQSSLYGND